MEITAQASETVMIAADTEDEEKLTEVEKDNLEKTKLNDIADIKEDNKQVLTEKDASNETTITEISDKDSKKESASTESSEEDETIVDGKETKIQDSETDTSKDEITETKITDTAKVETTEAETDIDTSIRLLSDDGNIASGTYKNVTWVIDENGKLTVSGTGDFKSSYGYAPWYNWREEIKTAVVNLSDTTNTSYMFYDCAYLEELDFSNFDTSNVENMSYMFSGCKYLENLKLSNKFSTSKVTDMSRMFLDCNSLTELDLKSFDTCNVTDMSWMFLGCSSLTELDLKSFNTSKVTNMYYMFNSCSSLVELDLSSFDTCNVTNMYAMFNNCTNLKKVDLNSFDTSNVTDMSDMFRLCENLKELKLSDKFNTSKVTNMEDMFYRCSSLEKLDLSSFNTSKVTSMDSMFSGCSSLIELNLSNFNTSKVTNMEDMFYKCSNLKKLDLSSFDTSKVNSMGSMFSGCSSLIELNLSNFNLAKQTDDYYCMDIASDSTLNKIYTPYNLNISIPLPNEGVWYKSDGTAITELPQNLSYSVVIEKNKIPETPENTYIKATKPKTNYTQGDTLNTDDIKVQYFSTDGKITTLTDGYTISPTNIDMNTLGTKTLTVTYKVDDTELMAKIEITVTEKEEQTTESETPNESETSASPENPNESETTTEHETPSDPEIPTKPDPTPVVTYVVTFDLNGGSSSAVNTQTVTSGEKVEKPTNPTLDGKTFGGWYSDSALTTPYNFSDSVTADITLYAKWDDFSTGFTYKFNETMTALLTKTYTGSAITPAVVVEYNGKALVKDVDYTITYKNNINVSTSEKTATATIKGKGGYSGNGKTLKFTIEPVDLNSSSVTCPSAISVVRGQKVGKLTIIYNGKTLTDGKDYSTEYEGADENHIFHGEGGSIKIKGVANGNFTIKEVPYREIAVTTVGKKSELGQISIKSFGITAQTYSGSEVKPTGYVLVDKKTKDVLIENKDYVVSYSNNIKVGTATVTFTGMANYTGSTAKKTFKISAPKLENIEGILNITKPNTSFKYNPNGVKFGSNDLKITCGSRTLCENTDYKISYKNNKKAGTAFYTITFIDDFKGLPTIKNQTFTIDPPSFGDSNNVTAVSADKLVKNSGAYKSAPVVTYMGTTVAKNEYNVKYYIDGKEIKGNKLDVTASTTVTVKIKSTGKTFANDNNEYEVCTYTVWNSAAAGVTDISKVIKKINITTDTSKTTYTGDEIKPIAGSDITITTKDGKEIKDKDFTNNFDVEYYNNINIGKATVLIKAKPDNTAGYIGSKTATFQITKPELSNN
jgi:uncharacterized repeat protein (TIGR02543 family)